MREEARKRTNTRFLWSNKKFEKNSIKVEYLIFLFFHSPTTWRMYALLFFGSVLIWNKFNENILCLQLVKLKITILMFEKLTRNWSFLELCNITTVRLWSVHKRAVVVSKFSLSFAYFTHTIMSGLFVGQKTFLHYHFEFNSLNINWKTLSLNKKKIRSTWTPEKCQLEAVFIDFKNQYYCRQTGKQQPLSQ